MAPSPIRSSVESRNAPNGLDFPVSRAMCPSMRSLKTNAVITRTPVSSLPCGKKTSAPAATPSVPTRVTASALTPSLMSRWATGEMTFVQKARKRSSMAGAGYPPGSGPGRPPLEGVWPPRGGRPGSDQLGEPQVREHEVALEDVEDVDARLPDARVAQRPAALAAGLQGRAGVVGRGAARPVVGPVHQQAGAAEAVQGLHLGQH